MTGTSSNSIKHAPWMTQWLMIAALYNTVFGLMAVLFPSQMFIWLGAVPPLYPELWQCVGMIVGVYGVGYFLAGLDPYRYWPVVLVGLLGKLFGPLGFIWAVFKGTFPLSFGWLILTNDIIWWIPFFLILLRKYQAFQQEAAGQMQQLSAQRNTLLSHAITAAGNSLEALSREQPLLLVFLRHSGCTFCRETLQSLKETLPVLEHHALKPVVIHMGSVAEGTAFLDEYGLGHLAQISNPSCDLYRALGLGRGKLNQLFGWKVISRGLQAGILQGHGVGALQGDGFQLSGYAVMEDGEVVMAHSHQHAGETTPFEALARHYGKVDKEGLPSALSGVERRNA